MTSAGEEGEYSLVVQTRLHPERESDFAEWQHRMSARASESPGFLGQEVLPPHPPVQADWVVIQRFASQDDIRQWLASEERAHLLAEAEPMKSGEDSVSVIANTHPAPSRPATVVIRTRVHPGSEDDFRRWFQRIDAAQRAAPGYVGSFLQEPVPGATREWVTMLAFDSADHLAQWTDSPERQALMDEAEGLMDRRQVRAVASGFEHWFATPSAAPDAGGELPLWKMNLIVLLALYPVVMLEILWLNPLLAWMELPFANFIGNAVSVGLVGWPLVGFLNGRLGWWVQPDPSRSRRGEIRGAAIVLLVLAAMVALFLLVDDFLQLAPVTSL